MKKINSNIIMTAIRFAYKKNFFVAKYGQNVGMQKYNEWMSAFQKKPFNKTKGKRSKGQKKTTGVRKAIKETRTFGFFNFMS